MRVKRIGLSLAAIAGLTVVWLSLGASIGVFAQGDVPTIPVVIDPTVAQLAGVASLAAIVAVITNIIRGPMPAAVFDQWGPTIAVIVAIVLALLGVFVGDGPKTGNSILQAVLVGAFAGWQSGLVNNQFMRLVRPPTG